MGNTHGNLNLEEKCSLVESANFSEDYVKRVYKRFKELDVNDTDSLKLETILNMSHMKNNPLSQRVVEVFDANSDGTLSFIELLIGLAKFTGDASELEKKKFVFDIYDYNKDGFISNGDLFKSLKLMVGDNLNDIKLQQLVDRTIISGDSDGDGMLSFCEFREITSHIDFKNSFGYHPGTF